MLPNYQAPVAYWQKLDAESDRMTLVDIGRTAEGRTQVMAIVTSPENHRNLAALARDRRTLARAEVDSATAAGLAAEGKAVVWIDGGLHATEVLGAQQLMETLWQLVSRDDAETRRILDDVVVLSVHANPDGMDLVCDWYMREPGPRERAPSRGIPRLYQKYIGHDNNRDFYVSTQPETENMNRVMYHQWFPQIIYNHHQTGPTGTVMFAPPFRDPFNYVFDPLVVTGLDLVGAAMHNRFIAEEKPGVTMRRGANYSTWWNGGLRTTTYFHNMIGLLTETIGNPTPMDIPFVANRQLPSADLPSPIAPQKWHFRSSIDYSVTANYAVLDFASRYRQTLLTNIWRMGRNSMRARRQRHAGPSTRAAWTACATVDRGGAAGAARREQRGDVGRRPVRRRAQPGGVARGTWRCCGGRSGATRAATSSPPTSRTFPRPPSSSTRCGRTASRCTATTDVALRERQAYPAGSYVVRTAQPFRPHVLDMFEPQDHPNDFLYEGGPPIPPYDNAGWTLAYQMGVQFDRMLDEFKAPMEVIDAWNLSRAGGPRRHAALGAGRLRPLPPPERRLHGGQPAAGGGRSRPPPHA